MKKEKIVYKGFGLCFVALLLLAITPTSSESEESEDFGYPSKTQTSGEGYAVGTTSLIQVNLNEKFKLRPSETAEVTDYEDLRITLGEIGWTGYPCEPGAPCIDLAIQYVDIKVYDPSEDEGVKARLYTIKNNEYAPNSVEVAGAIIKLLEIDQDGESAKFIVYNEDCIGEGEPTIYGSNCCPDLKWIGYNCAPGDPCPISAGYCTACGDGVCKSPEGKYNCPEDCAGDIDLRVKARTDKAVYEYGETVKIIAEVYDGRGVGNAEVTAEIYGPSEAVQFQLVSNVCSSSACVCPTNQKLCECNPTVSCTFEGSYRPSETGSYSVAVRAGYGGEKASDKTTFTVEEESEYKRVKLDEKFKLKPPETAVVVNYGDMQVKLVNIAVPRCATLSTRCIDGEPVATVQVSMPYVVDKIEATASTETEEAVAGAAASGTATQFQMTEGEIKNVFGATLALLDLTSSKGTFVVSGGSDYVDVKITPGSQRVESGDKIKYMITIRDNHPVPRCLTEEPRCLLPERLYTYNIQVTGLPFGIEYDAQVVMGAGETEDLTLVVDTSIRQVYKTEAEEATTAKAYDMADTGVVSAKPLAEVVVNKPLVAVASVAQVTAQVEVEETKEAVQIGPSYRFRVIVTQADDSGVRDVAYAVLYVIPGPPPSEKVRIPLKNGWNLITLPGKGALEGGSCSGEPYAFVYIKEYEKYYSLKEAKELLGEDGLQKYLRLHSFWIYSFEDCTLAFRLDEATSFNEVSLDTGWNFAPITGDMVGRKISDFSGDCEFKKIYGWDAEGQGWEVWGEGTALSNSDIYKGFIANAEDSCDFGWGAIISPPPLPE
jgi:hypothetical protein